MLFTASAGLVLGLQADKVKTVKRIAAALDFFMMY
jgi:hypothetical protein